MTGLRRSSPGLLFAVALVALVPLVAVSRCATAPSPETVSCDGFVTAKPTMLRSPQYPASARKMRMSGESTHEIVVDRSGGVRETQVVGTTFMVFALAADGALRQSRFDPATLEGRPVASRFWVRVPFGVPLQIEVSPARNRVTAFVPGTEPSRARWQLAGSVSRVTVVADVASVPAAEVSVVAIAPDGAERTLLEPRRGRPRRVVETVKTGSFFSRAGVYRIAMRHRGQPIAQGPFTVAEEEALAIVNACGAP